MSIFLRREAVVPDVDAKHPAMCNLLIFGRMSASEEPELAPSVGQDNGADRASYDADVSIGLLKIA